MHCIGCKERAEMNGVEFAGHNAKNAKTKMLWYLKIFHKETEVFSEFI